MAKFPFSSRGVEDKLVALYELSDPDLAYQALLIQTDFRLWIHDNFELDSTQSTYLANMDDDATAFYGRQCSLCFLHRLNITLIYPAPVPGYIKWVHSDDTISVKADGDGNVVVSGELAFTFSYE